MAAIAEEIKIFADLVPDCKSIVELNFDVSGRMSKALDGS